MATEAVEKKKGLIDVITEVLNGKADPSTLAPLVEGTRQELGLSRQGFEASVGALQPPIAEKVQLFVEGTREVISGYEHALELVEEYLKSHDRNVLVQAGEHVSRFTAQINKAFQTYRDAVLVAEGPTEVPNYNMILMCIKEWREGSSPVEKLRVMVERERITAKASIDALEKEPRLPEVLELKKAFQTHLDTATRLSVAARDGNQMAVDTETDKIKETFMSIGGLRAAAETAVRSQGDSPSGLVNLIVNTGRRVLRGEAHQAELAGLLDQVRPVIRSAEAQYQVITKAATDAERLNDAMEGARKAFATYDEAFRCFDQFFEAHYVNRLERGMQLLVEASKLQYAAEQRVLDVQEREGKVSCMKCGHPNNSDRSRCEKCGFALPITTGPTGGSVINTSDMPQGAGSDQPILSDTFRRLYEAVNGITDGTIGMDKFKETVAWFDELVQTQTSTVGTLRSDPEASSEVQEAFERAREHFENFKKDMDEALAEFHAFEGDEDRMHLLNGVRVCNRGANELLRAQRALSTTQGAPSGEEVVG